MDKKTGEKVKELRSIHKMTLKDLSQATDLSVSHLSQFERGIGSLSIYSLKRVAEALNTPLSYFLDTPATHSGYLMRAYEYSAVEMPASHLMYNRLGNSFPQSVLEPMLVTILPHQKHEDPYPKPHHGEEFIYVLEGVLTVLIDNEELLLNPGDSMHYKAASPHEWLNRSPYVVRLISVNTPRILPN